MTPPPPLERAGQVVVVKWLRAVLPAGSRVAAVKNEHAPTSKDKMARVRFFQKRKAEGVLTGHADLACYLPGPRLVLVEMKREKVGALSEEQDQFRTDMAALGFEVLVADGIETLRPELRRIGVPIRDATEDAADIGARVEKLRTKVRPGSRRRLPEDAVPW